MRTVCYFILICFYSTLLVSQNQRKLDSLLKLIQTQKEDTNKIKTFGNICNVLVFTDPKKSLRYGEQALSLAKQLNWKKGFAIAYTVIGCAYEGLGNNSIGLKYRLDELKIYEELNIKVKVCGAQSDIGALYSKLGNKVKALEYYFLSLKISEEIGKTQTTVNTLFNIAGDYQDLSKSDLALKYYYAALKLAKENNYKSSIAIIHGNLGLMYVNQKKYRLGLESYSLALASETELGHTGNMALLLLNMGIVYSYMGDSAKLLVNNTIMEKNYDKAINLFFSAYHLSEKLGDEELQCGILGQIGGLFAIEKKYKNSEEYLRKALELAKKIGAIYKIRDINEYLYGLYKQTGNYEKALIHYEEIEKFNDSLEKINNTKAISEIQMKYDFEKKESENKQLSQQNKIQALAIRNDKNIALILIIMVVLILGGAFFIIQQNKLRSKQIAGQLEQKLLRTQMNPHFIFNSLTNIESFIYENQPKEAGNYLAQFARLMRLILENSSSENISISKEIEILKYYFSLQKLRLNDNLDFIIDVDSSIDTEQVFLPPMLMQPFIENAIEHGFRGIEERGLIKICFIKKQKHLEIKITDNGIGLIKAQRQKALYTSHHSMALKITMQRLNYLNKAKGQKMIFSIQEIDGAKGTEVIFSIPL